MCIADCRPLDVMLSCRPVPRGEGPVEVGGNGNGNGNVLKIGGRERNDGQTTAVDEDLTRIC